MRVKAVVRFKDTKANVIRDVGEVFTCSADRFREINGTQFGTLVTKVAEPKARRKA